jgi:hypothetical protein
VNEGDDMSNAQISIQGYRVQAMGRWPESIQKRTTFRAARLALLRELAFDPAAASASGKRV